MIIDLLDPLYLLRTKPGKSLREVQLEEFSFDGDKIAIGDKQSFLRSPYGQTIRLSDDIEKDRFVMDFSRHEKIELSKNMLVNREDPSGNISLYDLVSYQMLFESSKKITLPFITRPARFLAWDFYWNFYQRYIPSYLHRLHTFDQITRLDPTLVFPPDGSTEKELFLRVQEMRFSRAWFAAKFFEYYRDDYERVFEDLHQLSPCQKSAFIAIGTLAQITPPEALGFVRGILPLSYLVETACQPERFAHMWHRQDAMEEQDRDYPYPILSTVSDFPGLTDSIRDSMFELPEQLQAYHCGDSDQPHNLSKEVTELAAIMPGITLWTNPCELETAEKVLTRWLEGDKNIDYEETDFGDYQLLEISSDNPPSCLRMLRITRDLQAHRIFIERNLYFIQDYLDVFDKDRTELEQLIRAGENETVEFKETLRYDLNKKCNNKHLFNEVIKTIAAFLNTNGGKILLGVADNGQTPGLDLAKEDFKSLDKLFLHINNIIARDLGDSILANFIRLNNHDIGGNPVVIIDCRQSSETTFLGDDIWVRVKAGKRKLSPKEAAQWSKTRQV